MGDSPEQPDVRISHSPNAENEGQPTQTNVDRRLEEVIRGVMREAEERNKAEILRQAAAGPLTAELMWELTIDFALQQFDLTGGALTAASINYSVAAECEAVLQRSSQEILDHVRKEL